MGIVETEYFTDENGVEMKKDIYVYRRLKRTK